MRGKMAASMSLGRRRRRVVKMTMPTTMMMMNLRTYSGAGVARQG